MAKYVMALFAYFAHLLRVSCVLEDWLGFTWNSRFSQISDASRGEGSHGMQACKQVTRRAPRAYRCTVKPALILAKCFAFVTRRHLTAKPRPRLQPFGIIRAPPFSFVFKFMLNSTKQSLMYLNSPLGTYVGTTLWYLRDNIKSTHAS